ncbi:striatin interacting protein [Arctopsyche grandis]|uniref:striatin interacting protein n=1 Tax=Arctopsyche grandis TaxID=121162 RepID=UPI00406D8730
MQKRQRDESEGEEEADSPVLNFAYGDCDSHADEIAELYTYSEAGEFPLNERAFERTLQGVGLAPAWQKLTDTERRAVCLLLLDRLESAEAGARGEAARALLYLLQGCWAEVQSDAEQRRWARANAMLLYAVGAFAALVQTLELHARAPPPPPPSSRSHPHPHPHPPHATIADSSELRVVLSALYIVTEVMRAERDRDRDQPEPSPSELHYAALADAFKEELNAPFGDELLAVKLLDTVMVFCAGDHPHVPMKKVLLLLWKVLLVQLGGASALKRRKAERRAERHLRPMTEDTVEVTRHMRPSTPPPSAGDLIDAQNQKRRPLRRQPIIKQVSLDESERGGNGNGNGERDRDRDRDQMQMEREDMCVSDEDYDYEDNGAFEGSNEVVGPPQSKTAPATPKASCRALRILPWMPKVRQRDVDAFLDGARLKFVGYQLPGDSVTLAGLPQPIHEGVSVLRNNVYVSLAELQIEREAEIAKSPLTRGEGDVEETEAEILYRAILQNLPQHMIALLKILLAAAPTSTGKSDSINIMGDVQEPIAPVTVVQTMKQTVDFNRHKEIIIKAVSAILLLLLKHFKLNHVYQFEFMSQHLVFANCIPLVLKFFNQYITSYVRAKNVIPIIEFPACVVGEQPELTMECLDIGDSSFVFSWRNLFSCINLLRILNKLTKWKHSRIMLLVVFKSAPILKRTLKVRQAMMQVYVLKLLKMQTKYLGRQWRKSNMKTISAIYAKVRHRLNDDWAFGNDVEARPWDFQAEECALRNHVDRFNKRRYLEPAPDIPADPCLATALSVPMHLGDDFKNNYELWLEQEVYSSNINWDILLQQ